MLRSYGKSLLISRRAIFFTVLAARHLLPMLRRRLPLSARIAAGTAPGTTCAIPMADAGVSSSVPKRRQKSWFSACWAGVNHRFRLLPASWRLAVRSRAAAVEHFVGIGDQRLRTLVVVLEESMGRSPQRLDRRIFFDNWDGRPITGSITSSGRPPRFELLQSSATSALPLAAPRFRRCSVLSGSRL